MPVYAEKEKVNGQTRWYIRTYVTDQNGNSKQVTRHNKGWIGREGKKQAEWEESKLKQNGIKTINENKINITVEEAFEELMIEDQLYNRNSESSRFTYKQRFGRYIGPLLGKCMIKNLDNTHVEQLIVEMKETNKDIDYINLMLQLLKRIYTFATKRYNIQSKVYFEPLREDKDKITPVTLEELLNQQITISPEEWDMFVAEIEKEIEETNDITEKIALMKMALLFSFEYILFVRVGEAQGIKMKNLVPECNIYVLYEAWNKNLKKLTPLKNRKARLLYMPPQLVNLFVNLFNELKKRYKITDDDFLFFSDENRDIPISRKTIDRYRTAFCKNATINYVTNHKFRHASISNAIYNEVDASALSDMTGQTKQVMFSTYVQTLKKANTQLINTLNEIKVPRLI